MAQTFTNDLVVIEQEDPDRTPTIISQAGS
jgi:hypothetical protein